MTTILTTRLLFNDQLNCFRVIQLSTKLHFKWPVRNVTNYKTKEKDVVERILKFYSNFTWICDKKTGLTTLAPQKINELEERINILFEEIKYWTENKSEKMIEIIELFY